MKRVFVLALLGVLAFTATAAEEAEEEDVVVEDGEEVGEEEVVDVMRPHIMVLKMYDGEPIAEGQNWTLTYTVVNAGDSAALDVEIADSFSDEAFQAVEGSFPVRFDKIAPEGKEEFNVTLVPQAAGEFETERASVTYKFEDEEDEEGMAEVTGFSSTLGTVRVHTPGEYARLTGSFVREWTTFAALASGPVLGPLAVFYTTK